MGTTCRYRFVSSLVRSCRRAKTCQAVLWGDVLRNLGARLQTFERGVSCHHQGDGHVRVQLYRSKVRINRA
jgi:hypothetical protein